MDSFYEQIAPLYHLMFEDWDATVEAQGQRLEQIIDSEWGASKRKVLDVSCGIGTQSLGMASRGFAVTASDLSPGEVARAKREADARNLAIDFSVCDMREANTHHGSGFDVVVCAGNSLPHLLSDDDILDGLRAMHACLGPSGGCVITVRDYDQEERGTGLIKPFLVRDDGDRRYIIIQVWDFIGEHYDFAMYFIEESKQTGELTTHVMRSKYYAISPNKILELMGEAGFENVHRLEAVQAQSAILVGTRA